MDPNFLIFLDYLERDYIKYPLLVILGVLIVVVSIFSLINDNLASNGFTKKRFKRIKGRKREVTDDGKKFIVRDGDVEFVLDSLPSESITIGVKHLEELEEAKLDYDYDDTAEANASVVISSNIAKKTLDDTESAIIVKEKKPFVPKFRITPEYKNDFEPIDIPKIFKGNRATEYETVERVSKANKLSEVRINKNIAQFGDGGVVSQGDRGETALQDETKLNIKADTTIKEKVDYQAKENNKANEGNLAEIKTYASNKNDVSQLNSKFVLDISNEPLSDSEFEAFSESIKPVPSILDEMAFKEKKAQFKEEEQVPQNEVDKKQKKQIEPMKEEELEKAVDNFAKEDKETAEEKIAKIISHNPPVGAFDEAVVFGKYEIFKCEDGSYKYHLYTNKNEAIYGHAGFKDIKTVLSHINSFKRSITEGKFEVQGDNELGFRFVLKRGNAEFRGIILKSKDRVLKIIENIKYYGITDIIRKD